MQLQYLAREILVEAAGAIDAGNGVGPDGNEIIEIDQHCWVALDREQHVDIAPEDVRPDCLAFIAARHVGHLVRGHAEMVRPEPDEALGEADLGGQGGIELGLDLLQNDLPFYGGDLLGLRRRGRRCRARARVIAHLLAVGLEPLGFLLRTLRDDLLRLPRGTRLKRGARGLGTGDELGLSMRPIPGRSSSASSAPRGSDAIAAIVPGGGPSRTDAGPARHCVEVIDHGALPVANLPSPGSARGNYAT